MRAKHGTAIYTGGGIYSLLGELDNGLYFCGDNFYIGIYNEDVRTWNKKEDCLAYFYNDWCEAHEVEADQNEVAAMIKDFCTRLQDNEPELTQGFTDFSNFDGAEVFRLMSKLWEGKA